jgi:hypothetical protein
MNKILYFYFWVSNDFEDNIAVKTHKYCLKKYIGVFDECNFVVALDDVLDVKSMEKAITWIDSVMCGKKYNVRFIKNTEIRESVVVLEDILPKIIQKSSDLVFVAHMKGVTNVTDGVRNKYSVLRWIISMYWYNFEYLGEVVYNLNHETGGAMYGALLTHFKNHLNPENSIVSHGAIYLGGFYWLQPYNYPKYCIYNCDELIPKDGISRYFNESLCKCIVFEYLKSHNNVCTENTIADLYYLEKEKWPAYLENYGDAEKCFDFQNEVLMNTIGELGK